MSNRFPLQSNWGLRPAGRESFSLSIFQLCAKWGIVTSPATFIIFTRFELQSINYLWALSSTSVRNILISPAGKPKPTEVYRDTRRGQEATAPSRGTNSFSLSFPTIIKTSSVPPVVAMMGLLTYIYVCIALFRTGPDALAIKSPHSHLCFVYIRPLPTPTDEATQLLIKF